ncbi:MAG: hypothetical protein JEZ09_15165 [Salinivirgaceae bacterium]|nr:hypothetical protein [Salinivirgaceae bacterium]
MPQAKLCKAFSLSSSEQSAGEYAKQEHGMLTYYLLKKLKETRGNITFAEMHNYLIKKIPIQSILENVKEQTPQLIKSPFCKALAF